MSASGVLSATGVQPESNCQRGEGQAEFQFQNNSFSFECQFQQRKRPGLRRAIDFAGEGARATSAKS
jgi:hypothetical protein